MADNNENGSGASTVLVAVVVVLLILAAFYFGFMRGGNPADGTNIDVNIPNPTESVGE
jgi:hypothetical protein